MSSQSLTIASLRVGTHGASDKAPLRKRSAAMMMKKEKKNDIRKNKLYLEKYTSRYNL